MCGEFSVVITPESKITFFGGDAGKSIQVWDMASARQVRRYSAWPPCRRGIYCDIGSEGKNTVSGSEDYKMLKCGMWWTCEDSLFFFGFRVSHICFLTGKFSPLFVHGLVNEKPINVELDWCLTQDTF